ncbi:MAG TPA: rhamnogalacturonan acetylesterase [Acidobacteriaceae bacterium]
MIASTHRPTRLVIGFFAVALAAAAPIAGVAQTSWRFQCASSPHAGDVLSATTLYAKPTAPDTSSFGFDLSTAPTRFDKDSCTGDKPFFFSLAVPDGNYEVTLTLGGKVASTTTVRAEARRLFVDQLHLAAGASKQVVFNVNVRTPTIYPAPGEATSTDALPEVRLKPREIGALDWDEKLTLEFNGDHPSLRSIFVRPITVPTVYLAGDSTVVDQDKEPWAAWGQMLPVFFDSGISIANEAESGETIKSFIGERRYAKIMSTIKPGDFLLVQFAHNDQKPGAGYVPAATDYKKYLLQYIADARSHGATPILVTSMNRRNFDASGKIVQTLGDYPQAMREVAAGQHVALIDLNALSKTLFEALGPEGTLHAFVHYPANTFPDQPIELKDETHFNSYGAYELARAIVQSIRNQHLPLEKYLRPNIPPFDPAHPEPFASWKLPPSPFVSTTTPYGR